MPIQPLSLCATHLSCGRQETLLFKPIGFSLASGDALVVEGVNGVGKTTLLRVLAGFLPPLSGMISCNIPMHNRVAYLGPQNGVKGLLTIKEIWGHADSDLLRRLQLTGLENTPCANLSSGQKQRVALGRIVLSGAPIWILDEPMNALDKNGEAIFHELLAHHLAQGGIAVIATHQAITLPRLKAITLEN
jgi:heme exporter protein A